MSLAGSNIFCDRLKKASCYRRETGSEAETLSLARGLGRLLQAGDWLALMGDLGAGKTVFVKGLGEALRCRGPVQSPTFVLIHTYPPLPGQGRLALHHVDLYRLAPEEVWGLGWEDIPAKTGVTVLEWGEKAQRFWPADCLPLVLSHQGGDRRLLEFYSLGDRSARLIERLKRM